MDGFDSDAYVVRVGWRGFWVMLAAAVGWTRLSAGVLHEHRLTDAAAKIAILGVLEIVFLAVAGHRAWLAVRREVVFAVDRQGVFFGDGQTRQPLPAPGAEAMLRAGRPDLIPGSDGTIRYAYRRMTGWRGNRTRLAQAVRRYAAGGARHRRTPVPARAQLAC